MTMDYEEFLKAKIKMADTLGFEIQDTEVNPILKPHQRAMVRWMVRMGRAACFAAFGLGKSVIQLETVRIILAKTGGRAIIVAPLSVRHEFARDASMLGIRTKFIRRIEECEDGIDVYLTNYESVRDGKLDPQQFQVASLDEASCFPAGTLVETPKGLVPIESIKIGDLILNASGVDRVKDAFKKEIHRAVRISVAGKKIISSDNHKFFTSRGWVVAAELRSGDAIVETCTAMRMLWEIDSTEGVAGGQEEVLRQILFSEMESNNRGRYGEREECWKSISDGWEQAASFNQSGCALADVAALRMVRECHCSEDSTGGSEKILQQELLRNVENVPAGYQGEDLQRNIKREALKITKSIFCVWLPISDSGKGKNSGSESNVKSCVCGKDEEVIAGADILIARREQSIDRASDKTIVGSGQFANGVPNKHSGCKESIRISSELLQGGYCAPGEAHSDRGGWEYSQAEEVEVFGQEKNFSAKCARVDSVEILECRHSDLDQYRDADGKLYFYDLTATRHPSFSVEGLLVHNCLRGFGGTKTFREFMAVFAGDRKTMNDRIYTDGVKYRFVATATPSPNEYIELLAYSAFLGVMDVGQAKTRFFKRDATKADTLTIHPHKEREFWLWVASWGLFVQKPSDLGYSDEGYALPEMDIRWHEIAGDHADAGTDFRGQYLLIKEQAVGLSKVAKEKRESLPQRIAKLMEIRAENPLASRIIWHDLEAERHAIEKSIPTVKSVFGSQDEDLKADRIIGFSDGEFQELAGKPSMLGSGCNFQRHCSRAVFLGIGFKFNDFIQAVHRIYRFLQTNQVRIDLIYTEQEREVRRILESKWQQHKTTVEEMTKIIKEFGLSNAAMEESLRRAIGVDRIEVTGTNFKVAHNDCIKETRIMESNSVDMVLTSVPFSTQHEYSPNYADLGHTDNNAHFFEQMDFLTPELMRVLKPGRVAAIHVKDRIVPGGLTGLGYQTVYPFHMKCTEHYAKHGFGYMGMITVVTDVVRENNQTYRLGWTEVCKDGSKISVGMPEYILLFRKSQSDTSNGYADEPVTKHKPDCQDDDGNVFPFVRGKQEVPGTGYSRARWQTDAHGFWRSNGNRYLTPAELETLSHAQIFRWFRDFHIHNIYDYEHHVKIAETLTQQGRLPSGFMLLQPPSHLPDVWTDVARMRTLNMLQQRKGQEQHLCLARDSRVLTKERGYVAIQDIVVGENVLTHQGRWKPVLIVKNTGLQPVVTVKAQGVPGLTLTPDHKLWARKSDWVRARDGAEATEPKWIEAEQTLGAYLNLKLPEIESNDGDETLWWIVGRWIADGHIDQRGCAVISCGPDKWGHFQEHIGRFGGNKPSVGTAIQLQLNDPGRVLRTILGKCGRGAGNKQIPPEAYSLPIDRARALLDGYLSGDGHQVPDRGNWIATSISRDLLLGISFLIQRVHGAIASIYAGRPEREHIIEGRKVHANQEWGINFDTAPCNKKPFILDDGAWKRVRSIDDAGEAETWCLKVADDESFTAEGCIVKNCPMQWDIADRLIERFTNKGETVYDPFGGIMTVPYRAILKGRKGVAAELSPRYFFDGVHYLQSAEREMSMPSLFDTLPVPEDARESELPEEISEE